MAVTKGHGNPNWTRDEVILALELYHQCLGIVPNQKDERVRQLSSILKRLPIHQDKFKTASFRNEDGVIFKLQNLRQIATGKGLGNTSQIDKQVWAELGSAPELVTTISRSIKESTSELFLIELDEESFEFFEGKILTQIHLRKERHRGIRKALLKDRRSKGPLFCDVCKITSDHLPPEIGDALFEAHHIIPISDGKERITRVKDMALLCANCHRLIHRFSAQLNRWINVEELRGFLK